VFFFFFFFFFLLFFFLQNFNLQTFFEKMNKYKRIHMLHRAYK